MQRCMTMCVAQAGSPTCTQATASNGGAHPRCRCWQQRGRQPWVLQGTAAGAAATHSTQGGGVLEQVWMCASTSEPKAGSHAHCGACSCLRISPQTCPAALPPAYMWPQPRWACAWGCRRRLGLVWQRWLRQHTRAQEQEHAVSKQWANASTPEGQPCCAQASQAWRAQLRAERAP
jgi:hypothetical protein